MIQKDRIEKQDSGRRNEEQSIFPTETESVQGQMNGATATARQGRFRLRVFSVGQSNNSLQSHSKFNEHVVSLDRTQAASMRSM
jgi:hypothetical protein